MGVEFVDRESGWRRRGRPRTPADPQIVALVQRTYVTGAVARITLGQDDSQADVTRTITQLHRAAAELGLRLRVQPRRAREAIARGAVQFYAETEGD